MASQKKECLVHYVLHADPLISAEVEVAKFFAIEHAHAHIGARSDMRVVTKTERIEDQHASHRASFEV